MIGLIKKVIKLDKEHTGAWIGRLKIQNAMYLLSIYKTPDLKDENYNEILKNKNTLDRKINISKMHRMLGTGGSCL
jgi:hypothetical protein